MGSEPIRLFYEIRPATLGGPRWAHWRNHDTDHEYLALPASDFIALQRRAEEAEATASGYRAILKGISGALIDAGVAVGPWTEFPEKIRSLSPSAAAPTPTPASGGRCPCGMPLERFELGLNIEAWRCVGPDGTHHPFHTPADAGRE